MSITNDDVLGYNISYGISPKIQIKNLENIDPNIQYLKSDDGMKLIGFEIKINTTDLNEAKKEGNKIADKIISFITLKTQSYVSYTNTGVSGIPKPGKTARVEKSSIIRYDIEGTPPILEMKKSDILTIMNLDHEQHGLLHRYAQAILYYTSNLPIDAFRELFAIIEYENEEKFSGHDKYNGLRQILLHRPNLKHSKPYRPETIDRFTDNFNENDFDYIEYNPNNNIIRINTNSPKTKRKMNKIVSELLFSKSMKDFIKKKCNL